MSCEEIVVSEVQSRTCGGIINYKEVIMINEKMPTEPKQKPKVRVEDVLGILGGVLSLLSIIVGVARKNREQPST